MIDIDATVVEADAPEVERRETRAETMSAHIEAATSTPGVNSEAPPALERARTKIRGAIPLYVKRDRQVHRWRLA